jgi:NADH-quinone oxidoreductase subunit M
MLWMVQRVLFGPKRRVAEHGMPDLTVREWFTVAPLLALILIIGVYPQPFLAASRVPAEDLIQRVVRNKPARPRGAMLEQSAPAEAREARAEGRR